MRDFHVGRSFGRGRWLSPEFIVNTRACNREKREFPMTTNSLRRLTAPVLAASLLAGLMLAACAYQHTPEQVEAHNPTVTYKYRNDDELFQANQRAATFCDQYQFAPRSVNFSNDRDGNKIVVFECMQPSQQRTEQLPQSNSNLSYNYRSDQELLDASRNARTYCINNGSRQMSSNIAQNNDGSRTITFQCNRG
jgi:hypothetical protein